MTQNKEPVQMPSLQEVQAVVIASRVLGLVTDGHIKTLSTGEIYDPIEWFLTDRKVGQETWDRIIEVILKDLGTGCSEYCHTIHVTDCSNFNE